MSLISLSAEAIPLLEQSAVLAGNGDLVAAHALLERAKAADPSHWLAYAQTAAVDLRNLESANAIREFNTAEQAFTSRTKLSLAVDALPLADALPSFRGVGWLGQSDLVVYQRDQRRPRFTIWDLHNRRPTVSIQFPVAAVDSVFSAPALRAALAQANGSIDVYSLLTGEYVNNSYNQYRLGYCFGISPSGKLLATCTGTTVQLGRLDSSTRPVNMVTNHPLGLIGQLLFSRDDGTLVGSVRKEILEWNTGTGKLLNTIQKSDEAGVALSADAQSLAVAGATGSIDILDATRGHLIQRIRATGAARDLAYVGSELALAVGFDSNSTIEVWDISRANRLWSRHICDHSVYATLGPSPDGHFLAVKCDDSIEVVDASTGEARLSIHEFARLPIQVAFGKADVLLTQDCYRARAWDLTTGALRASRAVEMKPLTPKAKGINDRHERRNTARWKAQTTAQSPSGRWSGVVVDNDVHIIDANASNLGKRLSFDSPVERILFAGDVGMFVAVTARHVELRAPSGSLQASLGKPAGPLRQLAASDNGERVLVHDSTGAIEVLAAPDLRHLCQRRELAALAALTSNGAQLLIDTLNGQGAIIDVATCKTLRTVQLTSTPECQKIALTLDADRRLVELVACSDRDKGELRIAFEGSGTKTIARFGEEGVGAALSPTAQWVAVNRELSGTVDLYAVQTGILVAQLGGIQAANVDAAYVLAQGSKIDIRGADKSLLEPYVGCRLGQHSFAFDLCRNVVEESGVLGHGVAAAQRARQRER